MTNIEKIRLENALKHIQKCDGDCKNCWHCKGITIADEKAIYYAFVCGVHGMSKYFGAISNSMKELKNEMIEAIQFELS